MIKLSIPICGIAVRKCATFALHTSAPPTQFYCVYLCRLLEIKSIGGVRFIIIVNSRRKKKQTKNPRYLLGLLILLNDKTQTEIWFLYLTDSGNIF